MAKTERAVFKVHIAGDIQAVWKEITKTDEIQKSFFNSLMDSPGLKPGAPVRMRSPDKKYTIVVGDVVEFDPPHRFSHTFKFTNYDDPPCKVTYDLNEVPGGVDFILTVDDMPAGTKTAKQMGQGGAMIVKTLKAVIETGRPTFGIRMLYVLFKIMAPLTPKKCLTKNWP